MISNNNTSLSTNIYQWTSFIAIWFLCQVGTTEAGLTWNNRTIDIQANMSDRSAMTEFKFANAGVQPIVIESVNTPCGCTTTQLEKKIYQPGESGVIQARFDFGNRQGLQRKQILVKTNDPSRPEILLTMRVHIPEILRIEPKSLIWKANELHLHKSLMVEVVDGESVNITDVAVNLKYPHIKKNNKDEPKQPNEKTFNIEFKKLKDNKAYQITVQPLIEQIGTRNHGQLVITTDIRIDDKPRQFNIPVILLANLPTEKIEKEPVVSKNSADDK